VLAEGALEGEDADGDGVHGMPAGRSCVVRLVRRSSRARGVLGTLGDFLVEV
jgi:hypothetical protein